MDREKEGERERMVTSVRTLRPLLTQRTDT